MPNLSGFEDNLKNSLNPNLPAKDIVEHIVVAALESEYGKNFTLTRGFARMVSALADSIVRNPDLRRQALQVASLYLKEKV